MALAIRPADGARRPGAAALLLLGGSMAVLFPGTGTMPFRWIDAIPAALSSSPSSSSADRHVRWTAGIVALGLPLLLVVPGAVGANITRLPWIAAAPIIIACAPLRRPAALSVVAAAAFWPIGDLVGQLGRPTPSSQAAYYQPLQAAVARQQNLAGAERIGQRIEVVDTANHWGSAYLSGLSLARGWDRQADYAYNPIFYDQDALTAASYESWLNSLAVGWVALPSAPLDYASVAEGQLIQDGLKYLQLTWSTPQWRLYRVLDSAPLVLGAQVTSVDGSGIVLTTTAATTVTTRIRWSPYLSATDPATGRALSTCVTDVGGWVNIVVPQAETLKLASHFDASVRLGGSCTQPATRS